MLEAKGVRSVKAAISIMLVHFLFLDQFKGFSGSSGPSQSTKFASFSGDADVTRTSGDVPFSGSST